MQNNISVVNVKNIRKANWIYISSWVLYYAWVIVFTTWWTASPITDSLLGASSRQLLHSSYLIVSAIAICILKKEWFRHTGKIGSIITLITAILTLTVKNPIFNTSSIIAFAIAIGIVNVSILIPFVYILNNTEKFYSMVGTFVLISGFLFLQETKILTMANGTLISLILLFISLIPIFFYKNSDLEKETPNLKYISKTKKVLYVTIVLNCIYAFFCKGIGKAFLDSAIVISNLKLYPIYYIGGLVGCLIYYIIYKFLKNSNHFTWNFTFSVFILALFIFTISKNDFDYYLFSLLTGIASSMGMINMYYILGVIGKKHWSHTYVKFSIILIGGVGGISGVKAGQYVSTLKGNASDSYLLLLSFITAVIILALSPLLSKTYYSEEWSSDSEKFEIDNEHISEFKKYKLTPKEIEVCKYLIDGYSLRQIAAMMNITENSTYGYQSKIYKKLNVNSRQKFLELFPKK